jgi:hypothetical protein
MRLGLAYMNHPSSRRNALQTMPMLGSWLLHLGKHHKAGKTNVQVARHMASTQQAGELTQHLPVAFEA